MILLNDFKRQWEDVAEEAVKAFQVVGASGSYILGKEVDAFEASLARYWRKEHAVGVASGLDAIEIALRVSGCAVGDRVLTTPVSAFATTLAIVRTGAAPVFVDCDESGLINLDQARCALKHRPDIRYFVPVHLYGQTLDTDVLRGIVEDFGVSLVEDCAQSIGAPSGMAGQMAACSFYPTKNLGAMGDGGAILTNRSDLAERARQMRNYGESAKYQHDLIGCNSRLDELQAALLDRVFMPRLNGWIARRREIAARYVSEIRNPGILFLTRGTPSSWHLFPVQVDNKFDFMSYLKRRGVLTGEHYPIAIPDQRVMANVPHEVIGDLDIARRLCRSEVSLPIHPYLKDDEVTQVIDAVNGWPA